MNSTLLHSQITKYYYINFKSSLKVKLVKCIHTAARPVNQWLPSISIYVWLQSSMILALGLDINLFHTR